MGYRVDGLKRQIAIALGLSPALLLGVGACSVRSLDDPNDLGDGDGDGSTSSDPTASTGDPGSGSGSGSGSEGSDTGSTGSTQTCFASDAWLEWEFTHPADANGQCICDQECRQTARSQWDQENCCDSCSYTFGEVLCSELLRGDCHYIVTMVEDGCGKGRPLFIDDRARTAAATERDDWAQPGLDPGVEGMPAPTRRRLADYWIDAALAEHASVASFARFVLDLASMGAPPALLRDANAAIQDEIRHAQAAFALAETYAGSAVGPGPLELQGLVVGTDPEAIVRAAVREGCVEETLAAAEAELAAHRATDPVVRRTLAAIAEDEARHAVLAWRFVDWALTRTPQLAAAIEDELQRATAAIEAAQPEPAPLGLDPEIASAHGMLPPALRQQLRARCMQDTVRTCGAAMVNAAVPPRSASRA